MPKLKAEFEDQNILVARHQTTLDDLRHVKVVNGIPQIRQGAYEGPERNGCERPPPWLILPWRSVWQTGRHTWRASSWMNQPAQALPERSRAMEGGYRDDDEAYHEFDRGCW